MTRAMKMCSAFDLALKKFQLSFLLLLLLLSLVLLLSLLLLLSILLALSSPLCHSPEPESALARARLLAVPVRTGVGCTKCQKSSDERALSGLLPDLLLLNSCSPLLSSYGLSRATQRRKALSKSRMRNACSPSFYTPRIWRRSAYHSSPSLRSSLWWRRMLSWFKVFLFGGNPGLSMTNWGWTNLVANIE